MNCKKHAHLLYDYFPITSLLRLVFNPFGVHHTNVIRQFLNKFSTWNGSSTVQKYVTSVQPYYNTWC